MIRIAITAEAFEAIVATLPFGSMDVEREPDANGERLVWIEDMWANRLAALRGPSESYSDVILRLVEIEQTRLNLRQSK